MTFGNASVNTIIYILINNYLVEILVHRLLNVNLDISEWSIASHFNGGIF